MFIVHGSYLRKHARWLLAGILVLLIPGFIVMFTRTDTASRREGRLPTVRGKPVNPAQLGNAEAAIRAQYLLNSGGKMPHTPHMEDMIAQEAVVRLVLLRKANDFGIRISDAELVHRIQSQPMFLTESGQFDADRYRQFTIRLNNMGVNETQFEEMMRQQLTLQRLQDLIGTGAEVTPEEVKLAYTPLYEKMTVEYVEFDATNATAPIAVSDADAQALFDKNQQQFRTPPQVKVSYALFPFDTTKQMAAITDKDIAEFYERNKTTFTNSLDTVKDEIRRQLAQNRAQRLAGDRATEFSVKLVPEGNAPRPDFAKLAAQSGAEARETGFFAQHDPVPDVQADTAFNQAAFALTTEAPFSDPVEGRDGYYVLGLIASKPSAVPPFEQVKSRAIAQLRQQRALEATIKQGQETQTKIKELAAKGTSFSEACAALKLKPQTAEPFSLSGDAPQIPAASAVKEAALGMPLNGISDFLRTATGGIIFHLKQRTPPTAAEFAADREKFTESLRDRARQGLWQTWVSEVLRTEQVNLQTKPATQQQPPASEIPAPESDETVPPAPAPAPGKS